MNVERELANVCADLVDSLTQIFQIPQLILNSIKAFHSIEWFKTIEDSYSEALNKMNQLICELKELQPLEYSKVMPGYLEFLCFQQQQTPCDKNLEEIYEAFYKEYKDKEEFYQFFYVFEKVNIKSYSEAYCESVGSSMNIITGKNRVMNDANFSRELFLKFNSPPPHVLMKKIIPKIVDELCQELRYSRSGDKTRHANFLKFRDLSASIGNYRDKVESSAHIPFKYFL